MIVPAESIGEYQYPQIRVGSRRCL